MQIQTPNGNFNFPEAENRDPITLKDLVTGQNIIFLRINDRNAYVFDQNSITTYWNNQNIEVPNPIPLYLNLPNPMTNTQVSLWRQGRLLAPLQSVQSIQPEMNPKIEPLSVIVQSSYNKRQANSYMEVVRSLFRYNEIHVLKAENDKEPTPENIMNVIEKAKKAPASTSIAALPSPSNVTQNDLQNLQDISLLDTYVSVNSSAYLYKNHPKPYDITKPNEAAQFTKDLANARFLVITKGLPGLLIAGESSQQSFSKTTTAADLHLEFLNEIFGSFGFSSSSLRQLDGIMTNIIKNLGALKLGWADQSETLDHLISTYFFEEVQGLGVKVPKIRLFYLHIDQSSWKASVGKSSVERFKFNMNYADYTFTMSLTTIPDMREPIKAYIKDMTKKNLEDIQKMVAMDAVAKD